MMPTSREAVPNSAAEVETYQIPNMGLQLIKIKSNKWYVQKQNTRLSTDISDRICKFLTEYGYQAQF